MARRGSPKPYQRTDRIGEQVRGIVASELERIGDERLDMLTVTAVRVDNSLDTADVFYSALSAQEEDRLDEVDEALEEVRWPIQQVVNRRVRARRTPQIRFRPDDVLEGALRIDALLAELADGGGAGADGSDARPGEPDGSGGEDDAPEGR